MTWTPHRRGAAILLLLLAGACAGIAEGKAPVVKVVRSGGWAPGATVRDGATEMLVLMEIARLQRGDAAAGLVAVGDRRGLFPAGAEEALAAAVRRGLPVVRLASGGRVLPAPHGLTLDGGGLSEEEAVAVLGRCLQRYGPLPIASADGEVREVSPELRERLRLFQNEFTLTASVRLAAR